MTRPCKAFLEENEIVCLLFIRKGAKLINSFHEGLKNNRSVAVYKYPLRQHLIKRTAQDVLFYVTSCSHHIFCGVGVIHMNHVLTSMCGLRSDFTILAALVLLACISADAQREA
jgi:hypothetical protein